MKTLSVILLVLLITACSSSGRYSQRQDSRPESISRDIDFKDVTAQYEPYLNASMRPYWVHGKHYTPLKTGKGYSHTGIASWYGQKFHGHLTANGEIYNMFAMSAAHKTLPLPSFVKVTNLQNGRQAVVRVNDRGPFHDNRVIDLSYAAAMKLGVLDSGTAKVKVDVIHVNEHGQITVGNQAEPQEPIIDRQDPKWFVQVAALQDKSKLTEMAKGLESLFQLPVNTPSDNGLYKLHLGPMKDEFHALEVLDELKKQGYSSAFRVLTMP